MVRFSYNKNTNNGEVQQLKNNNILDSRKGIFSMRCLNDMITNPQQGKKKTNTSICTLLI